MDFASNHAWWGGRFRHLAIAGLFALLGTLARLFAMAPSFAGIAIAVAIACAWSYGLDETAGGRRAAPVAVMPKRGSP
jgi:hypothetical protein